jgi:hypothetical protein
LRWSVTPNFPYFDAKEKDILVAAEHDIIYSVDIDEIIEAGITEKDATDLMLLNWGIDVDNDCLYCFV